MRARRLCCAAQFGAEIADIVLRLLDLRLHVPVVRLERVEVVPDHAELRLGARKRELERQIIKAVQDLAGLDMLVLRDIDFLDDAGDIGRDADLVGFDIGVVHRHHLAAGDIPVSAGDQRERQQQKQPPAHPPPGRRLCRLCRRADGSAGLSDRRSGEPDASERGATVTLSSGIGTSCNTEGSSPRSVDVRRN